jgi:hypothetical protein
VQQNDVTAQRLTASGSLYHDGTFPSRANWDNDIKWCHVTMQNYDPEAKAKHVKCHRDMNMMHELDATMITIVTGESASAAPATTPTTMSTTESAAATNDTS